MTAPAECGAVGGLAAAANYTATASHPATATVEWGAAGREKVSEDPAGRPAQVLAAAAIGTFKSGGTRAKRATRGARAHLTNTPSPWTDANPWSQLLKARRGLQFSVRVLTKILQMFRSKGSTPLEGSPGEALTARALVLLFQGEQENAFEACDRQRAGGSSSVYDLVEHRSIVTLQGRRFDPGSAEDPSIVRMDLPAVLPPVQYAQYVVPVLSPFSDIIIICLLPSSYSRPWQRSVTPARGC